MEEWVDLHEEAGKENEQTLTNLSPAEEATGKVRSVCTGDLGQDSPIQTSPSVNKS